jgi:lipopolysaccharide export system protein LptA
VCWGFLLGIILPGSAGAAESFSFSSDSLTTVTAEGRERTLLKGNARVVSESTEIEAERIEIFGDDSRYIICTGNVRVVDSEQGIRLESQKLFYDRELDIIRIDGYASMVDEKNELLVEGGFLENRGEEDITIIQIGVRIMKPDMVSRSEFARFDREDEILELSGDPDVTWKGDEYRASRIVMNLDTEEINLEGSVQGTVRETEDEAEETTEGEDEEADEAVGTEE